MIDFYKSKSINKRIWVNIMNIYNSKKNSNFIEGFNWKKPYFNLIKTHVPILRENIINYFKN